MSPTDPESAEHANVSVQGDVVARRPGLSFRLTPELRAVRYADNAEVDRNDAFAVFGLGVERPRQSVTFGAHYARESTLTSEFETSGLRGDVERTERGVDAAYSHTLSSKRSLGIAASDVDTVYADSPVPVYGDYGFKSVQLSHRVATNEHTSWSLVARKSFVEASLALGDSTTTALQSSWSRKLGPHLQGTFGVGAFLVDSVSAESEDANVSFNFALTRDWSRWTLSGSAGRDVRPQSGGVVVVEEIVALTARWTAGERTSVSMQLRGAHSSLAVERLFDYGRSYSHAGVSVNWRAARRLDLAASVYERAEDSSFASRASGLVGSLLLTYRSG